MNRITVEVYGPHGKEERTITVTDTDGALSAIEDLLARLDRPATEATKGGRE